MSLATTRAPSCASRIAVALPMPEPAPVTIAVRPSNRAVVEVMSRSLLDVGSLSIARYAAARGGVGPKVLREPRHLLW